MNMDTMSLIQKQCLLVEYLSNFHTALNEMMDKYMIEDSIFVFNQQLMEATKGYFVKIAEYGSLDEALSSIKYEDANKVGVRVVENKTFQIGFVKKSLYECSNDDTVFDIDKMIDVR